jgi:hypothetical protein
MLRQNKDESVKRVRSKFDGDIIDVRAAASAFRRMVRDADQVKRIKLNQEQEVLDLWTNAILAEKERGKGKKVGGPGDPGKAGSVEYFFATSGPLLLVPGELEADRPAPENPFRWVKFPDKAVMPGIPESARALNLDRRIGDIPVVRVMRIVITDFASSFSVAMSADGTETAQSFPYTTPEIMQWVLASFLLEKPINPSTDEGLRLIQANWRLGSPNVGTKFATRPSENWAFQASVEVGDRKRWNSFAVSISPIAWTSANKLSGKNER